MPRRSALASTEEVCCSTAEPQGKHLSEPSCSLSSRPERVELQAQEDSQGCLGEGCATGPIVKLSTAAKRAVCSCSPLFVMCGCVLPYITTCYTNFSRPNRLRFSFEREMYSVTLRSVSSGGACSFVQQALVLEERSSARDPLTPFPPIRRVPTCTIPFGPRCFGGQSVRASNIYCTERFLAPPTRSC